MKLLKLTSNNDTHNKENNMANPLGIVARLTRPVIGTASDYFKKFDYMMKQGNVENITERCFG